MKNNIMGQDAMRILILTQYIYPENFKSSEMAFELARRGHQVDSLTGIPNYPAGVYFDGYGIFKKRYEKKDGVRFFRCFQTPRGKKASAIGLILNYSTFVISSTLWVLFFFVWRKKYDVIITHEPSPITQIIPAIILSKIRKVPVYSWIMDIWPDSMVSRLSPGQAKIAVPLLNKITNWIYRGSHKILITSKGFNDFINRDADYSEKIIYFPNWSDDIASMPKTDIPELPKGYIIMMAGNIANSIGPDDVINLINECRNIPSVHFVFVGGGSKVNEMKERVNSMSLTNAFFLGQYPFSAMSSFYMQADAMLLTLKKGSKPFLNATVPARLQSYMSAGKPVLGMADGGAYELINENDIGFCAHAGDYRALSSYIRDVLNDEQTFAKKGEKARNLYEKEFTKSKCIDNLERIITE